MDKKFCCIATMGTWLHCQGLKDEPSFVLSYELLTVPCLLVEKQLADRHLAY